MASDSSGGAPKKLSTQEILARARAEAAKKAAGGEAAPAPATPAAPPEAPAPAAPKPAAGGKPKSTADILAAARAAKGGGASPEASAPTPAAKPAASKPAAAGGAPKSTADILAAARANKAGGAAAAPAAKPAADKPAAKPAAAKVAAVAASEGPALSVEEMLAAVRPGGAPSAATATDKPVVAAKVAPPMPVRPVSAAKGPAAKAGTGETRRGFLAVLAVLASPFVLAWTAFTATAGVWGLGLARFMLPNVLTEPPSKFKIGPPTDYDLGTVATKWVAQFGIWIVHTDQYKGRNLIYALASVCTHLGCTPSWLEGERKFKCPCHGSGFYITGINFEGPAPRPLERVGIRLAEDGMLEVDKSVKFQEEMGQWNDVSSFFEVTA